MAIRLTRIYTRSGDQGLTSLVGGSRVPKEGARLEAYGTVDELNAVVGIVRTYLPAYKRRFGKDYNWYAECLRRIQNELFDVGSELATPPPAEYAGMHHMGAAEVAKLEEEMDRMQKELKPLNSFTLPGGGVLNAFLHQARTVCRRAERVCWSLRRVEPINDQLLIYINRLSDHLFVQSRWVARRLKEPEFLWDRALRMEPRTADAANAAPSGNGRRASAGQGGARRAGGAAKDASGRGKR
ncbi:MAG TPA: cob(I)yrinic acid a,c-diamide adenosyltransferase [Candidatus Binataceae bacterium]|jgi:cob(I)alamin adenosyltransferase|nr:cob(I)yrinic acid a,c-diamide adenosyltransferase [Candidatus Binataceae bacterium]